MIKAIVSDFSQVLLFPTDDSYSGSLNDLYTQEKQNDNFAFFDYFRLNVELLEFYNSLKPQLKIFMFTSEQIQKDKALEPYLVPVFDDIFSAQDLGVSKKEAQSYKLLGELIDINLEEILIVDDSIINLDAAHEAGMNTLQYRRNDQLITQIHNFISKV